MLFPLCSSRTSLSANHKTSCNLTQGEMSRKFCSHLQKLKKQSLADVQCGHYLLFLVENANVPTRWVSLMATIQKAIILLPWYAPLKTIRGQIIEHVICLSPWDHCQTVGRVLC